MTTTNPTHYIITKHHAAIPVVAANRNAAMDQAEAMGLGAVVARIDVALPALTAKVTPQAWLLIANDEPDQICYTERTAKKERKDLEAMGCTVIMLPMVTPGAAEELESAIKYGPRSLLGAIRHARAMGDIVKA